MTVNELLVLMKKVRERKMSLESLRNQTATRNKWVRNMTASETMQVEEPQYDSKAIDRRIMELENFLFKADAAVKQSNARTEVPIKVDVDALLAPME